MNYKIAQKSLIIIAVVVVMGLIASLMFHPELSRVRADSARQESFAGTMSFNQEVGNATSTATTTQAGTMPSGAALFALNQNGQSIAYRVETRNLTSGITEAHLHCAPPGQNGPAIVPLVSTISSTVLEGTVTEASILPVAMKCQPNIQTLAHLTQAMREGQIYVNVHTVNNPMGEVRGQLGKNDGSFSFATSTTATSTATSTTATSTTSTSTPTQTAATSTATSTATTTPTPTASRGWDYVFVQPDSYYKIQGDSIRFLGSHFIPGERVSVNGNGTQVQTVVEDGSGGFVSDWMQVPYVVGNRTYTFIGNQSNKPFTVNVYVGSESPWIILSTYYAGAGAPVKISGHQFGAHEKVNLWFNGVPFGSAETDARGTFEVQTTVPNVGTGQWTVRAVGESSRVTATQPFSQSY